MGETQVVILGNEMVILGNEKPPAKDGNTKGDRAWILRPGSIMLALDSPSLHLLYMENKQTSYLLKSTKF